MKYTLIVIFTLLAFCSNGKLFKGTVGKYPIVLSFPTEEIGSYSGNGGYFYESKRQQIIFTEASGTKNHVILKVGDAEKFDLLKNPDGSYRGIWSSDNKKLDVKIAPFAIESIKNPYYAKVQYDDEELWYVASSKLIFKVDTTTLVGSHKIQWLKDNIYGIVFFRIISDKTPNLNHFLENIHLELVNAPFRGCSCDDEETYTQPFEITETGKDIISYSAAQGICYCYSAAHPSWFEETANLDLKKDEELDFDKVFQFSKIPVPNKHNEKTYLAWSDYRSKYVATKIVEMLHKIDKTLKRPPENYNDRADDECYYLDENKFWSMENWQLEKQGIKVVHSDGAGGYGPCFDTFAIPSRMLKPYVRAEYQNRVFIK